MVSSGAARTTVGILGNISAVILFMSPLPTFIGICKKGTVEQFSPVPYLAGLMNCSIWVVYALPMVEPNSILFLIINGIGCAFELIYLLLFLCYSDQRKRLRVLLIMVGEFIVVVTLAVLVLTLAHTTKLRAAIVGSIAIAGGISMYASPLSIMRMVISTKSVEYMPFTLSLASFATGLCWTIYALIPFDPYIAAPNGIGTLLGLAQLILYATYYKSTKRLILERQGKGQKGLVESTISYESNKISKSTQNGHISGEA